METVISKLEFESLDDKELTVLNGVLRLFELLCLDDDQKSRCVMYLYDRFYTNLDEEIDRNSPVS